VVNQFCFEVHKFKLEQQGSPAPRHIIVHCTHGFNRTGVTSHHITSHHITSHHITGLAARRACLDKPCRKVVGLPCLRLGGGSAIGWRVFDALVFETRVLGLVAVGTVHIAVSCRVYAGELDGPSRGHVNQSGCLNFCCFPQPRHLQGLVHSPALQVQS
jgi:hypothetical protein